MLPFISAGPVALPSKALVILIGVYLTTLLLERLAKRFEFDPNQLSNWGTTALIGGFVGARIGFVVANWATFRTDLIGIVWPITVGYLLWPGLCIGLAILLADSVRRGLPLGRALDAATPAGVWLLLIFVLGDFFGGPGFGTATGNPAYPRHWVQAYEIGVVLIGWVVWGVASRWPNRPWDGWLATLTVGVIAFGLIWTLPFRGDPWLINGFNGVQVIAWLAALAAFGAIAWRSGRV